jgi:precorrin-6B methylase 2
MDSKGMDLSNNKVMDDILVTNNEEMDDKISSTLDLISTSSSKEAATRAISLALIRRERNITRNTNDWEREQKWKTASNYNEEETNGSFCYEFDKNLPGIKPKTLFITETHESTGDRVWDASILLARFLEKEIRINTVSSLLSSSLIHKDKIQKQEEILRVAEIGAGQGLLSLVIASLCPYSKILATDLSFVASRMAKNAKRNGFIISTDSLKEEEKISLKEEEEEEMISIDTNKKKMLEKMSNKTEMKIFTETETEIMKEYERNSTNQESITEKCLKFNITELNWGDEEGLYQAIQWLGDKPHLLIASDLAAQVSLMPSCVNTLNGLIGKDTILYLATNSQRDSTTPLLDGLHQCIDLKIEKIKDTLLPLTSKWVDVWKVTRM